MSKKLFKNRCWLIGFCLITLLSLLAVLAPLITSRAPDEIDSENLLMPPSLTHIMGTDQMGRDLFSRVAHGARVSLTIGLIVVVISTAAGVMLGAAAGYYGGFIDQLLMRFTDMMLCFPVFFLILTVIAMLEPSIFNIIVILGLTSWMGQARLVRAQVLSLKTKEYVLAARAYGASDFYIITKHLIPNAFGPVLVSAILGVAYAILAESSLSFLGIGVQPPTPSWGNILSDAKATLGLAWWLNLYPGLALLTAILGCNLLGEGLRDYMLERS